MATNIDQKKTHFIGVPDFENTVLAGHETEPATFCCTILRWSTLQVKDTSEISNFQF